MQLCYAESLHLGGVASACDPSGGQEGGMWGAEHWACAGHAESLSSPNTGSLARLGRRAGECGCWRGSNRVRRATEQRMLSALCSGRITGLNVPCRSPCTACCHRPPLLFARFLFYCLHGNEPLTTSLAAKFLRTVEHIQLAVVQHMHDMLTV
jgi:hypothetical protein